MESQETINEDDTVKIDPSELSDKVVEDLIEEGAFDHGDAEEYGDRVWFERVKTPEPTKKEGLSEKVSNSVSEIYGSWKQRSAFINLKSVARTEDDRVRINMFNHELGESKATFSPNSSVLGNIMALADVDNPKELEGGRLVVEKNGSDHPVIAVPTNLSIYGRLKYKIYSCARYILTKTNINTVTDDNVFGLFMATMFSMIPAIFMIVPMSDNFLGLVSLILSIPFMICLTLSGFVVSYGLFRVTMYLLSSVSSTEVSKTRITE